jgi:hypothetical protein
LGRGIGFGSTAAHREIGGAENPLQRFATALGAFHVNVPIVTAHDQDFNILMAVGTFEFVDRHKNILVSGRHQASFLLSLHRHCQ